MSNPLQKMVLRLDSGPLAASSEEVEILPDHTTPLLGAMLAEIGGKLIADNLTNLLNEKFTMNEQNEADATYCGIIKKEDGHVNWKADTAVDIERKLRAYTPWPGIFSFCRAKDKTENNKRLQFTKVEVVQGNFKPGEIYPGMIVGAYTDGLKILTIKPEGKNEMDADSFLRGNSQILGSVLR